jgi:polyisoprenoid-binding protein YceI
MNTRSMFRSIALLAAALSLPRLAHSADVYKIDPRHTSIIFSIGHAGLSYTYGMFRTVKGDYVIDKQNQANNRFHLEIEADSLFTNDKERDDHLRSPDFFNTKQFPIITFDSTSCVISTNAEGAVECQLIGTLTMHGQPRQINFPMQMLAERRGPRGDYRTGFYCTLELKRSDFGMKGLLDKDIVGDAVRVTISFEGVSDPTAANPVSVRRQN